MTNQLREVVAEMREYFDGDYPVPTRKAGEWADRLATLPTQSAAAEAALREARLLLTKARLFIPVGQKLRSKIDAYLTQYDQTRSSEIFVQVDDDMVSRFMQEALAQGLITVQGTAVEKSARAILAAALRTPASGGNDMAEHCRQAGCQVLTPCGTSSLHPEGDGGRCKNCNGDGWNWLAGKPAHPDNQYPCGTCSGTGRTAPPTQQEANVELLDPSKDFEVALFFHDEELTYTGYKRVSVKSSKKNWKELKNGDLVNKIPIVFPPTQVSSYKFEDRATHVAIISKNKRICTGPLALCVALDIKGIKPQFSAGTLKITKR